MKFAEKNEKITEFIRTSNRPVSRSEICKATGVKMGSGFKMAMTEIMTLNPKIVRTGRGRGIKYEYVVTPVKLKPEIKSMPGMQMKNVEGYTDHTASKAIQNVAKAEPEKKIVPAFGDVWTFSKKSDTTFLVVSVKESTAIGFLVYGNRKEVKETPYTVSWPRGMWRYYVSTLNVCTYPVYQLGSKLYNFDEANKTKLREKVNALFDIQPATNIIKAGIPEEEVETMLNEQEAELKKRSEDREAKLQKQIDDLVAENKRIQDDIGNRLTKQKLDIYERIIFQRGA